MLNPAPAASISPKTLAPRVLRRSSLTRNPNPNPQELYGLAYDRYQAVQPWCRRVAGRGPRGPPGEAAGSGGGLEERGVKEHCTSRELARIAGGIHAWLGLASV